MATEIELKLLLVDEAAHDVVRSALDRIDPHATTLDQVNYYLDTPRADLHGCSASHVRYSAAVSLACASVMASPYRDIGAHVELSFSTWLCSC